ncbi:MAG: hypothetical protein Q7S55_03645 [Nanoarchaeota archaeon]|nr:hypothetical protein [Nanoarchaeota archaeon]
MNKAKLSTTLIVLLGLLIFLPLFASAAPSITESSVKLTADYSKFADEDDDFIAVTTESFTIVNNGADMTVTIKAEGLPSKYDFQSNSKLILANTSETVTLTIEVPHHNSPGQEKIGTIAIYDGSTLLDTTDLLQETISMLDLTELEVKYVDAEGKTQKDEFASDDDTYKLETEVKPYTDMTFTFDLQNLFDKDYQDKGELEEIELTLDVDDEALLVEGFEDTHPIENIEAGKERKYTLTLPINEEVEADTYTLEFTIVAEDSEGIQYEIKKELTVEIQLDDDDVRILQAKLVPETATICDKEASLQVEVHNFGSDDQDTVKVTLQNTELGLDEKIENIAIDAHTEDDDSWQKTFVIPLENTKVKTYFLDFKTYIDNTLTDVKVAQLVLKSCASPELVEEEEEQSEPSTTAAPEKEPAETEDMDTESLTGNIIKSIEKASYTSNDYLVALMLIAITVSAAMIVLMLVVLFKA